MISPSLIGTKDKEVRGFMTSKTLREMTLRFSDMLSPRKAKLTFWHP